MVLVSPGSRTRKSNIARRRVQRENTVNSLDVPGITSLVGLTRSATTVVGIQVLGKCAHIMKLTIITCSRAAHAVLLASASVRQMSRGGHTVGRRAPEVCATISQQTPNSQRAFCEYSYDKACDTTSRGALDLSCLPPKRTCTSRL